jgi:hypothetical protein
MKKGINSLLLTALLSVATMTGCQRESREYLLALESKDRLIESSHKARRDAIESLGHRSLARADRAMADESKIEEQTIYLEATLDRYRPHKPNQQMFEHATRVLDDLKAQHNELTDQWVQVFGNAESENAIKLSEKIRDIELAIAEASEVAKRSQPTQGTTSTSVPTQTDPVED